MIVYKKLGEYLKDKDKKYIDLQREMGLSPSIIAKFQKNRTVSTDTINKICEYLHVQPGDIMEWIPDSVYNEQNKERFEIEKQISLLQEQLRNLK